jgi:MFS family permease
MSIFGSLIAHALVQNASWRWVFWIGLIFGAISLIGTAIFYFPPSHPRSTEKTKWQEFLGLDFLGIFLYTCGLTLFLVGISWGGISYPWNSAPVIAPIFIGGVLFIACFFWDFSGIPKTPLFPLHLFKKTREYTILLS